MKKSILFSIIFYILFCFFTDGQTAEYSFYFSNTGTDTPDGSASTSCNATDNACSTMSHANTVIGYCSSSDIVYIYFNRDDTWSYDSAQDSTADCYGVCPISGDPVVHIDAYGSGAKPKFDGLVSDFSAVEYHNEDGDGPERWNTFFKFLRSDCSVQNVEITRVYGHGIWGVNNGTSSLGADSLYVANCDINNFGTAAISVSAAYGISSPVTGNIFENNTLHTGQQLPMNGKCSNQSYPNSCWSGAIQAQSQDSIYSNNEARYNIIYDIYGEGINLLNGLAEYNVVGDTWSSAIGCSVFQEDWGTQTVRYNYIVHSSSSDYYSGNSVGLRVYDEQTPGENGSADIQVYGNIVINKAYGIRIFTVAGVDTIGLVKIYNNLFIDNRVHNMSISQAANFAEGYIYNNASILYDRTGVTHVTDSGVLTTWTIENNAFWTTGGSPTVDTDWNTDAVTTDPELPGEDSSDDAPINWDGLTAWTDVEYTKHLYPTSGALVASGKVLTFDQTFLTTGTDFADVIDGESAFEEIDQDNTDPDIGPWARGEPGGPAAGVVFNGSKLN